MGRGARGGRGRGNRGGRGRGKRVAPDSDINPQIDYQNTEESENLDLIKSTIDSYSRELPMHIAKYPETGLTQETIEKLSGVLSNLPLDGQLSYEFLVPLPSYNQTIPEKPKQQIKPETKQTPKSQQQLESWLDGLLG